ncbi:MAG: hypothetical protein II333_08140, partial [Clostridia bacterium]|nr:hypothetical protein [Clostridia bacterium]
MLKHCKFWVKNLPICPVVWYDSNEVLYLLWGYGNFEYKFVKADQTTVAGVADALNFTDASSQGAGRV